MKISVLDVVVQLPLVQPLGGKVKFSGVEFKIGLRGDSLGFLDNDRVRQWHSPSMRRVVVRDPSEKMCLKFHL